ncbi:uncharacterized protein MELLADRAFT_114618, partial [Melampsora larici-populina 98AG31]
MYAEVDEQFEVFSRKCYMAYKVALEKINNLHVPTLEVSTPLTDVTTTTPFEQIASQICVVLEAIDNKFTINAKVPKSNTTGLVLHEVVDSPCPLTCEQSQKLYKN